MDGDLEEVIFITPLIKVHLFKQNTLRDQDFLRTEEKSTNLNNIFKLKSLTM